MFLGLLQKLARVDTIQSILVLIDDFIHDRPEAASYFTTKSPEKCYSALFKLLTKDDEFIQLKAAKIVIKLLVYLSLSILF